ncbi:hypothetical protein DPMN_184331 [Dreissena polymorpha]|uniref:Uncharacterized protein n=1 Tax=Dreissena polymorpha TaxID=45954 RepID=A0A9D4I7S7_DREPO|nr:hypothetical protein DPMN_184331 [Dreissena polymorpha]
MLWRDSGFIEIKNAVRPLLYPVFATDASRLLKNCSTNSGVEYFALFDSSADGLRVEILDSHRLRNPYSQQLLSVFF